MVKSVKEVLSDDFWIMPATPEYKAEGIPYITSKNIKNGVIDFGNVNYISEEDYESISKNRPIKIGDILISMIGTLGETAEVTEHDGKFYGQNMFLVRLNNEAVNKRYFLNFFQSGAVKRALAGSQNQSTQKYLKANHIEDLQIPVPSIDEQSEIANRLDLLSLVLSQRKKQLDKLDELIKARFVEMFGDPNIEFKFESHKFKEYVFDMTKGPFGSDMKKDLYVPKGEDTYKVYIQINAIQGNQDLGDYYISKEYFNQKISKFEVHPGDYIITCDGTLGKHLKLNENMERGVISPSLLRLTLDESKMTREYFEYMWDMYMLLLMKKEARNACLIHLPSAKVIGEVDVPVAPFELQKNFSVFVEQVDKSKFVSN